MEAVSSSVASVDRHIHRIEHYLRLTRHSFVPRQASLRTPCGGAAARKNCRTSAEGTAEGLGTKGCARTFKHQENTKHFGRESRPEANPKDAPKIRAKRAPARPTIEVPVELSDRHVTRAVPSPIVGKVVQQHSKEVRLERHSGLSRHRKKLSLESSDTINLSSLSTTLLDDSTPLTGAKTTPLSFGGSLPGSSLTSASFSSLEYSPVGELATRWLQWRRVAYGLLASHYEKVCGMLCEADSTTSNYTATVGLFRIAHVGKYRSNAFKGDSPRRTQAVADLDNSTESLCSLHKTEDMYLNETTIDYHAIDATSCSNTTSSSNRAFKIKRKKSGNNTPYQLRHTTKCEECEARSAIEHREDECVTELMRDAGRSAATATERSAHRLKEQRHRIQHQQLLSEVQREECEARGVIEHREDECVTELMRDAGRSAATATERSAHRLKEQRHRIQHQQLLSEVQREECEARGVIEHREDECVTALMRDAGRSAASATERSAHRLKEQRHRIQHQQLLSEVQREECEARGVIEHREDECVTELMRDAGRSAATATERSAHRLKEQRHRIQHQQLLSEVQREECEARGVIEHREDECVTALMRDAGRSAASATERSAHRLKEQRHRIQHQQLLSEVQREECEARGVIEHREDECVTALVRDAGRSAATATERSAHRLKEQRHRIQHQQLLSEVQREECEARGVIEHREDEWVTELMRDAGRSAATATERSAHRLKEQRHRIQHQQLLSEVQREECEARGVIEHREDEWVTELMRDAGRSAATATERSAHRLKEQRHRIQHQQLLSEVQREECEARGVIEHREDECVTALMRDAGRSAASATERSAHRLKEQRHRIQHQQLLSEVQREECEARGVIEHRGDECVSDMENFEGRSPSSAVGVFSSDATRVSPHPRWNPVLKSSLYERDEEVLSIKRVVGDGLAHDRFSNEGKTRDPVDNSSLFGFTGASQPLFPYSDRDGNSGNTLHCAADAPNLYNPFVGESCCQSSGHETSGTQYPKQTEHSVCPYGDVVPVSEDHCSTLLSRLIKSEVRSRWYNESVEYYARNEMRWDELNSYRAIARQSPNSSLRLRGGRGCADGDVSGGRQYSDLGVASSFKGETRSPLEYADVCSSRDPPERGRLPSASMENSDVPSINWVFNEGDGHQIEPKHPTALYHLEQEKQRERGVAWSISVTDGRQRPPPHLRARPWAPLLTRKKALGKSAGHNADAAACVMKIGKNMRRTVSPQRATENATHREEVVGVSTLVRTGCNSNARAQHQTRPQLSAQTSVGYAQLYKNHLRKQKNQLMRHQRSSDPIYCKVTVSFLESAAWRYQKMYVDNYLFPFLGTASSAPSVRRCADDICGEVKRAMSAWDFLGYQDGHPPVGSPIDM